MTASPACAPAPWLRMAGIVKRFPGVLANDGASLEVGRGEIHALLGENGAGKSTLMQILYGMQQADAGSIWLDGQRLTSRTPAEAIGSGIGMVHQEFMLVQPFTVAENVALGQSAAPGWRLANTERQVAEVAARHGLAIEPRARIEQLPIGLQQRVEILKLLCRNARLLILDEPTAVLTPSEKDSLFTVLRALAAEGRSVVIVTHKLHEIMEIAARVTIMRAGRTVDCVATAGSSPQALARAMVGREVALTTRRATSVPGAQVLQLQALQVPGERAPLAVRDTSLTVHAGEIVGIAGVDGNGQGELLQAVAGLRPLRQGRIDLDGASLAGLDVARRRARGLAYVPADRRHVGSVPELPVRENALLGLQRRFSRLRGWWRDEAAITGHARMLVQRFGVRTAGLEVAAGGLSGGNLQKLILGRELMRAPRLLMVEQPTRGLDVGAIESVWAELLAERARGMAILLVSAELDEIFALADRIAVMYEGRIVQVLANDPTGDAGALRQRVGMLMAGLDATPQEEEAIHGTAA